MTGRTDSLRIDDVMNLPSINSYCLVLERLAKAAGQTRWHIAKDDADLAFIIAAVVPGSAVSLYFDERFKRSNWSDETSRAVLDVVKAHGECVVAVESSNGGELSPFFISGANDLVEFLGELEAGAVVYFGSYPMQDNDGTRAVSFIVPDALGRIDLPR